MIQKHKEITFEYDSEVDKEVISWNMQKLNSKKKLVNIAEEVKKELDKDSEQLLELNRFQTNMSIIGLIKTNLVKNLDVKAKYHVFFLSHPLELDKKKIFNEFVESNPDTIKSYFEINDPSNEKDVKNALKQLDKNDPKRKLLDYLMNLKPFPNNNTDEITLEEHDEFKNFFIEFVNREEEPLKCPWDGENIENPHINYVGIAFCSEKCASHYQYLLNNQTDHEIKFEYSFDWRALGEDRQSTDNWGAIMAKSPNSCRLCAMETVTNFDKMISTYQVTQQKRTATAIISRAVIIRQEYFICKHCKELLGVEMIGPPQMRRMKFGMKDGDKLKGYKIKNLYRNFDWGGNSKICVFTSHDRLLTWHYMMMNRPRIRCEDLIAILKSFRSIDPKYGLSWLEQDHVVDWTQQFSAMYQVNSEPETNDPETWKIN